MGLSVGIVGLPNVGKSTTFNALSRARNAAAANYPFCTIDASRAIVPVPDARLAELARIVNPKQVVPATVGFTDIAGLVKGASKGEGLGNQFLANVRENEAILHLVRCFEDENVVHVDGSVDPARDVAVIETELILADIQTLEKRLDRLEKQLKGDRKLQAQIDAGRKLAAWLDGGKPAVSFPEWDSPDCRALDRELRLLTGKPVIFAANIDEAALAGGSPLLATMEKLAGERGAPLVRLCSRIEEEMIEMADDERNAFLHDLGAAESGLDQIIRLGYRTLGLASYFTAGPKEVRAWTIEQGWKAPRAAAVIHQDFERGFIRAEVIGYEDYVKHNGEAGARSVGALRTEGKDYEVRDGDVMHFLFNV
jgi:GTP-binding protein YchF